LPVEKNHFDYLHRGKNAIAFRVPDDDVLRNVLQQTGPLIAPSANIQGVNPAIMIDHAVEYFGKNVDFYVDGGVLNNEPSTLIRFENNTPVVLRVGSVAIA
jgi:L-threonylcarbamoyladenylate synthase